MVILSVHNHFDRLRRLSTDHVQPPQRTWPPPVVPLGSFDIETLNRIAGQDTSMEVWKVHSLLNAVVEPAFQAGLPSAPGFWVIAGAAMMVMSPADPGRIWGPRVTTETVRFPSPVDFKGAQNEVLAKIVPLLTHFALKAHLADIVWTNERRLRTIADLAVNAYTDTALCLLQGQSGHAEPSSIYRVPAVLDRALQIDNQTRKRGERCDRLTTTFEMAYAEAVNRGEPGLFKKLSELALHYKLINICALAIGAEATANNAADDVYPVVKAEALGLASAMYERLGDRTGKVRCLLASAECQLAMRGRVSGPAAEAHWVQQALYTIRGLKEAEQRRRVLRHELRDLQEDSLDHMMSFDFPIDLDMLAAEVEDETNKLDLAGALREFLIAVPIPEYQKLHAEALRQAEAGVIGTIIAIGHIDELGRIAANTGPLGPDGPNDEWLKTTMSRQASIQRQIFVQSFFEPARLKTSAICDMQEEHFRTLVASSPFVPITHWGLVALGLLRMFQGDYRSAAHLLIPQLEPCLRHVLRMLGHDPSTEYDNLTEQDLSLSNILSRFKTQLTSILSEGLVLEIELLFDHRSGPALRHGFAHGRISDSGCFSSDAIYACWFIYRLVALPLLPSWNAVAAAIRAVDGR